MVKFRLTRVLALSFVMFLSASLVMAQGDGNRRGGGRGGFGGGFGGVGGVMGLLNNEEVQKELALDDATKASVKKITDAAAEEARTGAGGGFEGLRDLPEAERRAKMEELRAKGVEARAKIVAKYQPQVKEALTPAQFERAQQIYWQSNTTRALSDPDLVKALDVTKEQQDKIAAVGKEYDEKQRELFPRRAGGGNGGGGNGGGDFAAMREKMTALNKERETKVTDVLTADQKTKFATLKGKEFDVAKLRGGFGGGRGGRGGRPAGGNN